MSNTVIEVNVPGPQGPAGAANLDPVRGNTDPILFEADSSYALNSYVVYLGKEYRALVAVDPNTFLPTQWQEVSVQANELRIRNLELGA